MEPGDNERAKLGIGQWISPWMPPWLRREERVLFHRDVVERLEHTFEYIAGWK